MASEPISSDPSTTVEQMEKESPDKLKTIEESVVALKENEEKAKEEGTPTGVCVPSSESEEKIKEKESELSTVEEVVSAGVEEKPKADESSSLDVASSGPEEVKVDKHIEPSPPEDVIGSEVVPILDVSPTDKQELSDDHVVEVGKADDSRGADDSMQSEAQTQPENKDLEKPLAESVKETVVEKPEITNKTELPESAEKVLEAKEEQAEELPKKTEPSQSLADAAAIEEEQEKASPEKIEIPKSVHEASKDELEQSERRIPKEVTEVKDVGTSSVEEEKKEDALVSAPGEDMSEGKAEITEELKKESVKAEPIEKIEVDAAKYEEIPINKVEQTELKSEVEPVAAEISKTTEEAHVEPKDTEVPPAESSEKIDAKDPLKTKEETIETEKVATDAKCEDKKEDGGVTEELAVPEAKGIEEAASSVIKTQDSGRVSEAEQTSREIELPANIEGKTDEALSTVAETEKDVEVEKKVDIEESQKSETGSEGEEKASESVEPPGEKQEEFEENTKPDAPIEESVKGTDDAKAAEAAPKEEPPVKQKHSNNLLSKVKQSLVKAKKAIIKKPPSKTPSAS